MKNESNYPAELISENYSSINFETTSPDYYELPVIKIDQKGRILYANRASFQILEEWLKAANEYLPEYFLKSNPEILNPDADFSVPLNTSGTTLKFDVIGFKEGGYIGLYGFN
jgi:hypothetical protein